MRGAKKPVGAMETTGARPALMVTITWSGLGIGVGIGLGLGLEMVTATAVIAVLPLTVWRTVRAKRYAAGASARGPSDHAQPSGATRPHVPEGGLSAKEVPGGGPSPKGTVPSSGWQLHEKDSSALHAPG